MDTRKYFALKKIGYFPPTVTYPKFMELVETADPSTLPFRTDGLGGLSHGQPPSIGEQLIEWDKLR
jgi:hypothetical protein